MISIIMISIIMRKAQMSQETSAIWGKHKLVKRRLQYEEITNDSRDIYNLRKAQMIQETSAI